MIKATAYYPEYFPDMMEADLQKIRDGGIEAIRFGEFAWGLIEPEEGRFDFAIFDRAFEFTERMGMSVILCTPTACPPAWLAAKHPQILPVNAAGQTIGFGARQHRCYNAPEMRAATERVVSALAERYGTKPNLMAWQIDNELAAEHKYCYCDACVQRYQDFLRRKYGSIGELNRRWFTTFWAQNYSDFSQILPPRQVEAYLTMKPHPSALFEFLRFSSDSVVQFSNLQAEVIRRHSGKPVTTNQDDFHYGDNVDWAALFGSLDVVAFDIYSTRLHEVGFYYDYSRCVKQKPFWQMEFHAGSPVLPDMLDMSARKGCELFGLFTYRPFPAGQEQSVAGMIDHLGNPLPNYAAFRDWQPSTAPASTGKRATLIYDYQSSWAYNTMEYHHWESGFTQAFSRLVYKEYVIHTVYKSLFDGGFEVEVLPDLTRAAIDAPLIVPMHIVHDPDFADALLDFMKRGGQVITTADLFLRDQDNAYHSQLPAFFIELGFAGRYPAPGERAAYGDGCIRFADPATDQAGWAELLR